MAKSPKVKFTFAEPPAGMEHHAADDKELASIKSAIPAVEVSREQRLVSEQTAFGRSLKDDPTLEELSFSIRRHLGALQNKRIPLSFDRVEWSEYNFQFLECWKEFNDDAVALKARLQELLTPHPNLSAVIEKMFGIGPKKPKKGTSLSGEVTGTTPMNFNVEDLKNDLKIEEIKLRSSLGGLLNVMEQLSQQSQEAHADIALTLQSDADEAKDSFENLCKTMHLILQKVIEAEELTKAFRKVHNECFTLLSQTDRFKKPSGLETED